MRKKTGHFILSVLAVFGLAMTGVNAGDDGMYAVTVTNLTHGQIFTPILVVTHKKGVKIFSEGSAASEPLAQLATGGATQPLQDALFATGKAYSAAGSGPVPPGQSVTIKVAMNDDYKYLSVASMLIPTNDAFFALNGVKGPKGGKSMTFVSSAYDAGSELNDELCANIPGPDCGGAGNQLSVGEGYVHVHAGIHGVGDLAPELRDWRNPVAKITIQRIKQ